VELTATVGKVLGVDANSLITADLVDLDAVTGIADGGTALDLTSATTISADTTNGNIDLDHAADVATEAASHILAGTGHLAGLKRKLV